MPTYNLRRFSDPSVLKHIAPARLFQLLSPHIDYFSGRGVAVPPPGSHNGIDYQDLANVLITPDENMLPDLVEALYFIHEMATYDGMDSLLEEVGEAEGLNLGLKCTPADVAVAVWLHDPRLLEKKHLEANLTRPRSFDYYQSSASGGEAPRMENLGALEEDLQGWFQGRKRGRGCRVFEYPENGEVHFLVRHGEPFRREGSLANGEPGSVFFRPEAYDTLVYSKERGELRLKARTKGEKKAYRKKFGLHLFGDSEFFSETGKYTLEPLRTEERAATVCGDVSGLEWIKLREIHYFWGGVENEIEIRKATDLFEAFERRGVGIPKGSWPRILKAKFEMKFVNAKRTRSVTVKPPNVTLYTRDADSVLVEKWLELRGFILGSIEP